LTVTRKPKIAVFGAGGHAKVVVDVLAKMKRYEVVALLDDSAELHGTRRWGFPIWGGREQFPTLRKRGVTGLIVGLGDNRLRQSVYEDAAKAGIKMITAVHPSAQIGSRVRIGAGSLLVAGAVVNVDAEIGDDVIINTGATVDHDCRIGAHVHLSPGVHLAGGVTVGELTHIGIGAVVLPNVQVGRACIVGAGAVVRESIPDGAVVAGNPARLIRNDEESRGL
jgi:sugar O-acyltransferase (sialic acid O-acetyltransferase NeuD family)